MIVEYRGYNIQGDGTFGMKVIKWAGKSGSIPKDLEGSFTKVNDAKISIDSYLLKKQEIEDRPPPIKKVKLYPREVKQDDAESDSTG